MCHAICLFLSTVLAELAARADSQARGVYPGAEGRRSWIAEQKARIVAESYGSAETVSAFAPSARANSLSSYCGFATIE
jgi:hypothetical protein